MTMTTTIVEEEKTVQLDEALEGVFISAVRYALGRRTYIVADTIDYITPLLSEMSDGALRTLHNDVRCEIDFMTRIGKTVGDQIDHERWVKFLTDIDTIINMRLEAQKEQKKAELV